MEWLFLEQVWMGKKRGSRALRAQELGWGGTGQRVGGVHRDWK